MTDVEIETEDRYDPLAAYQSETERGLQTNARSQGCTCMFRVLRHGIVARENVKQSATRGASNCDHTEGRAVVIPDSLEGVDTADLSVHPDNEGETA